MIALLLFKLNILVKHLVRLKKNSLNPHLILSPTANILLYPALFCHRIMHNKTTQRTHHVESVVIRWQYHVDTSKIKIQRISASF